MMARHPAVIAVWLSVSYPPCKVKRPSSYRLKNLSSMLNLPHLQTISLAPCIFYQFVPAHVIIYCVHTYGAPTYAITGEKNFPRSQCGNAIFFICTTHSMLFSRVCFFCQNTLYIKLRSNLNYMLVLFSIHGSSTLTRICYIHYEKGRTQVTVYMHAS